MVFDDVQGLHFNLAESQVNFAKSQNYMSTSKMKLAK